MKRGGLPKKTGLSSTKPLKKSSTLGVTSLKKVRKPKKRLKLEQKTAQQMQKDVDKWHSQYVRLRDSEVVGSEFIGTCITCTKTGVVAWHDGKKLRFTKGWDAGHFIERGILSIRYEEENVNLQCSFHCNKMKSGNHERYKGALDDKYGNGTYRRLEELATLPEARKRLTKPELLQVIHDSKTQIDFYERQLDGQEN